MKGEDVDIKELNEFMLNHGFCNTNNEEDLPKKYVCDLIESAIKDGYYKAIDEFAQRMKELVYKWIDKGVIAVGCIDEIAEEMKKGE